MTAMMAVSVVVSYDLGHRSGFNCGYSNGYFVGETNGKAEQVLGPATVITLSPGEEFTVQMMNLLGLHVAANVSGVAAFETHPYNETAEMYIGLHARQLGNTGFVSYGIVRYGFEVNSSGPGWVPTVVIKANPLNSGPVAVYIDYPVVLTIQPGWTQPASC